MVIRRWCIVAVAVALVGAACSSSDDGDETTAEESTTVPEAPPSDTAAPDEETDQPVEAMEPGIQTGITDTEINIALLYGDTTPLQDTGLVPNYGDFEQDFQAFVDKANAEGRFGGRTVSVQYASVPVPSTATDQTAGCLEVTQDRENFIVFAPGGLLESTISCVTAQNETLFLMIAGSNSDEIFEVSDGRFFNNAMRTARIFEVAVRDYAEQGRLDGATIGIIRPSAPEDESAAASLKQELTANGFEVAEEVALVCEGGNCEGVEPGIERLRTAGVDALFSFFGFPAYPAIVGAAGNAGYTPQWYSSDYQNQVLDTTAQFMQEVAEFYDGAIGTTSAIHQSAPDEFRQECNDYFTDQTGIVWEPLTDGWRLVGNFCEAIDRSARVIEKIEADGLEVGQDTFIAYMERETVLNGDRTGTFGPDKHDAYDVTATLEFDADCKPPDERGITVCWNELEGTRSTWGE